MPFVSHFAKLHPVNTSVLMVLVVYQFLIVITFVQIRAAWIHVQCVKQDVNLMEIIKAHVLYVKSSVCN
jgi:hypothetical protein